MTPFEELADAVLDASGIDSDRSFVTATRHIEVTPVSRVPSSENWNERRERKTVYRCFLRRELDRDSGPNFAERSGTDLREVIRDTFAAVGINSPIKVTL